MSRAQDVDGQFRTLHQDAVRVYEEDLNRHRELHEQRGRGRQERENEFMKALGMLDPDLTRVTDQDTAALEGQLRQARESLVGRVSNPSLNAKRLAMHPALQIPNARLTTVYATSLMAGQQASLEGIEGERGNPWVMPWNPGEIKIREIAQDGSEGLCWLARPYVPPVVADVYFAFISDKTAMWTLDACFSFSGFYVLGAVKDWWNCRDSRVTLDAQMNVYQYFWNGNRQFSLLNVESQSGVKSGFYDQDLQQFVYQVMLKADPDYYVFAWIRILIHADAYGKGSRSEINFREGANVITPLALIAWPS
jgi:hypothetical protein